MPLLTPQASSVSPVGEKARKPSTLENIALALGIAKDVIGTGLDVYGAKLKKEELGIKREEAARPDYGRIEDARRQGKLTPEQKSAWAQMYPNEPFPENVGVYEDQTKAGRTQSLAQRLKEKEPITPYQQQLIDLRNKEIQNQKDAAAGAGTGRKKLVELEIENYAEQGKQLPEAQDRVNRINQALRLVSKVPTGYVVGSRPGVALRKIFGDSRNIQMLENLLNKEGLEVVASFAQRAGARSIDSDKERAYVQSVAPGLDKDPEVLRTILLTTKSVLEQGLEENNAKRNWLQTNENFRNYISPLATKRSYYDPKTMEVGFFEPGKEPNGWNSLAERINDDPQGKGPLTWDEEQLEQYLLKKAKE